MVNNSDDMNTLLAGGILLVVFAVFALVLVLQVFVCWLLSSTLTRVPAQFRKQEPGLVWLLLIPCVSLVWNFFVYPKVSQSLKAYFNSIGRNDVGDCAEGLGLAYSICVACSVVPFLNYLAGPAALVIVIIFLVKITSLKNEIPLEAAMAAPSYPPPA
jgi:hypothetical protein